MSRKCRKLKKHYVFRTKLGSYTENKSTIGKYMKFWPKKICHILQFYYVYCATILNPFAQYTQTPLPPPRPPPAWPGGGGGEGEGEREEFFRNGVGWTILCLGAAAPNMIISKCPKGHQKERICFRGRRAKVRVQEFILPRVNGAPLGAICFMGRTVHTREYIPTLVLLLLHAYLWNIFDLFHAP